MAEWYYQNVGKAVGPISESMMREWIRNGSVAREQLVRSDDSADWRTAEAAFADLFPKSTAPDFLADLSSSYFECDGLCFFPVFDIAKGFCRVSLFYQNRYSGECQAEICLRPAPDFWQRYPAKKPLHFKVTCGGGEFGVIRQLYGLNPRKQGKVAQFVLEGNAAYPKVKGEILRIERGHAVDSRERGETALHVLVAVLTLGHLIIRHKPASMFLRLPTGVARDTPEGMACETATLWSMEQAASSERE